ncbi:MAG: hypothetical protein AAGA94_16630 [Pseudomonadota bacterium]
MRRVDQGVEVFQKLGGAGRLEHVYRYVQATADELLSPTWREGICGRICEHSSDAGLALRGNLFEMIAPADFETCEEAAP